MYRNPSQPSHQSSKPTHTSEVAKQNAEKWLEPSSHNNVNKRKAMQSLKIIQKKIDRAEGSVIVTGRNAGKNF